MAEDIVRCPYCVLGDQFRIMLQRPEWFICERCGHVVLSEDPGFRCPCGRCLELSRAA
jgi:rubrerythrin